jgi:hypothetical protein
MDTIMKQLHPFSILVPWRQYPKVHHRVDDSPPPVHILKQVNLPHTLPANLPKIHSNPIPTPPSTPRSSEWSLSSGHSPQNHVHLHACHMPRTTHSPRFDLPNDIWGWAQIMKLSITQLSPFSRYFIPLRSTHSPQHPVLRHSQSMLFP